MQMESANDIIKAIRRGELDEDLNRIGEELNARYKARRAEATRSLRVGSRVRVIDHPNMKNKDHVGMTAVVTKKNQQTVTLDFGGGDIWRYPATILEVV